MTVKVDLKRTLAEYAAKLGRFDVIDVPERQFLCIDGVGDPNTSDAYREAIETLYPVSYKLKFFSKNELGRDYTVMPLEALWWAEDMAAFTSARDKSRWSWTAMILVPDWLGGAEIEQAIDAVRGKGGAPALDVIRLESITEGLSVQTLHVGSYDDEGPVLAEMHDVVMPREGLEFAGKHHEIYLSDARRVAPENLRTILRQPVRRV